MRSVRPTGRGLKRWLVAGVIAVQLHGCGLGTYVSDFMAGEENTTPPAPLTEFEPTIEVEELWSVDIGAGTDEHYLKLAPAIADETVFIADRDGEVYAVDIDSGDTLWEQDTDAPVSGGPGIAEEMVLLGTQDGEVLALSRSDGELLWTASVSSEVLSPPAGEEGIVVARTVDGKLFGIDAVNGKRLWTYDRQVPVLTLRGTSAPIVVAGLTASPASTAARWLPSRSLPVRSPGRYRSPSREADPTSNAWSMWMPICWFSAIRSTWPPTADGWPRYRSRAAASSGTRSILRMPEWGWMPITSTSPMMRASCGRSIAFPVAPYGGKKNCAAARRRRRLSAGDYVVVGDLEGYLHWMRSDSGKLAARVQVDDAAIIVPPLIVNATVIAYSSSGTLSAYRAGSE